MCHRCPSRIVTTFQIEGNEFSPLTYSVLHEKNIAYPCQNVFNRNQHILYPKLWKQRRYVFLRFYLHKDIEKMMIAFLIRLLSQSRYWSGEEKRNQWSYYNEVQWSYYNISSIAPTYPRFMLYKLSCFYLLSELLPQTLP